MKKITVSAPGKLMLLGEHAVVYNHPCLVTAVDQRIYLTASFIKDKHFQLEAPDVKITGYKKSIEEIGKGDIPKGAQFIEIAIRNVMDKCPFLLGKERSEASGVKISTKSEFSSQFGFGSSSASTVCLIKALSELFELNLTQKEIFDLSFKTVLDIQGKGSGFDVAAAIYGGTLFFLTGGKIIEPLPIKSLPLIVGYSGIKADTVMLMNSVKEKFKNNQNLLNEIYNSIENLVNSAKIAFLQDDYNLAGKLMNKNQVLLIELGVSIPELDKMINAAISAGAYGAKLSGAGGGDCIIAFAPKEKRKKVEQKITSVGGKIIHINTNSKGVSLEN